jgi:C-terminal processing protease CtpA/Prc
MLWDDPNIAVIGETSAGTNGNITGGYLPGGYYMDFTGMHVLNPDGSELHGVGIPLDEEVVPTAEDFADGRDPELDAAIAWFAR